MLEASGNSKEWIVLQHDYEQYEKYALWLKITAVVLCFVSLAVVVDLLLVGILIAILWLQEAVLRTGQSRISRHILMLEEQYRRESAVTIQPFQLHSNWLANRGNKLTLLSEYAANALRPTVAFPYAVLLLILLAALSTPSS